MSQLLIQFSHLSKFFDSIPLFDDVSLSIHEGDVFALIGKNGAGKTTLLKLLTEEIKADAGHFSRGQQLTIGFLPQEVILANTTIIVREYIEEGPLSILERKMVDCLEYPDRLAIWAELHEKYEQLGGYRRIPIEKVLNGLKLKSDLLDLPISNLSSGQRVRVKLAKVLIENPDLLLLDEPTNHLDHEMIDWLKQMLCLRGGATVIVSHDRKFLNATCNRLVEINKSKLTCYGGDYDFYLKERKRLLDSQMKAYEKQEEERAFLKQQIKAMTFSKRKAPLPKDRNHMAYDKRGEHYQKSLQRNLDVLKIRLTEIETNPLQHPKPKSIQGIRFTQTLLSSTAIELDQISKAFGEKSIFSDFTKTIGKGDRILLTGSNGAGKTTLLRCIIGLIPVDKGQIRFSPSTKIAYMDQEVELLPMEKTPFQYFETQFSLSEKELRSELHKADIGGVELLYRPFSSLSIGQRKRLLLLSMILQKPNILLLDEPTNHLDFLILEAFEGALLNFDGAILAVSHDTTFIKKIAKQEWIL